MEQIAIKTRTATPTATISAEQTNSVVCIGQEDLWALFAQSELRGTNTVTMITDTVADLKKRNNQKE